MARDGEGRVRASIERGGPQAPAAGRHRVFEAERTCKLALAHEGKATCDVKIHLTLDTAGDDGAAWRDRRTYTGAKAAGRPRPAPQSHPVWKSNFTKRSERLHHRRDACGRRRCELAGGSAIAPANCTRRTGRFPHRSHLQKMCVRQRGPRGAAHELAGITFGPTDPAGVKMLVRRLPVIAVEDSAALPACCRPSGT